MSLLLIKIFASLPIYTSFNRVVIYASCVNNTQIQCVWTPETSVFPNSMDSWTILTIWNLSRSLCHNSPSVLPSTPTYGPASSDSGLEVSCLTRGRVCLESSVLFLRPWMPTPRRRSKQLPDSLKKKRRCWKLKQEEELDRTQRITRFGRGRGLFVKHSMWWWWWR